MSYRWVKSLLLTMVSILVLIGSSGVASTREPTSDSGTLAVTASTPPQEDHFQATLTASKTRTFAQDQTTEYTLSYGSTRDHPTEPFVLEVEWDRGTVSKSQGILTDVLEYVQGSAEAAYAHTPPTVDLKHRTIRWSIASLPAHTINQTVHFKLKMVEGYTGPESVIGHIKYRIIVPTVTLPDRSIPYTYRYNPRPEQARVIPMDTLAFQHLDFTNVGATTATLVATLTVPSRLAVQYGRSTTDLPDTVASSTFGTTHTVTLEDLKPDSEYVVAVTATGSEGQTMAATLMQLHTATVSRAPTLQLSSLIVTSGGTLLSGTETGESVQAILMPTGEYYEFTLHIDQSEYVRLVQAFFGSSSADHQISTSSDRRSTHQSLTSSVLHRFTMVIPVHAAEAAPVPDTTSSTNQPMTDMVPSGGGNYSGRLKTPEQPGLYPVNVQITDTLGNVVTETAFELNVTAPLTVQRAPDGQPIENARVFLESLDEHDQRYHAIASGSLGFSNPLHTASDGTVTLSLPKGQFQATVSAIGYNDQTVEFTIGMHDHDGFPTVKLQPTAFSPLTVGKYYLTTLQDFLAATRQYLQSIANSERLLDLNGLIVLGLAVLLSLIAFRCRTHIPLRSAYRYLRDAFFHTIGSRSAKPIVGRVVDRSHLPISRATVTFVDEQLNTVVGQAMTNRIGQFFCAVPAGSYQIMILHNGYEPASTLQYQSATAGNEPLTLVLNQRRHQPVLQRTVTTIATDLWGMGFELLLMASFGLEILFTLTVGWQRTWLFFLVSSLNLIYWFVYRHYEHLLTAPTKVSPQSARSTVD
ncbi:carboxypeptidase regulatory-like domain-containing protein [Candidatus Berkelbacteria bacterium]|nr:carboxypeptidase regulatory-like domain-containing protein [Candidatus Berkelbacteria bacterium]